MTTEWTCMLVDLANLGLAATWQEQTLGLDFATTLSCVSSVEEATAMLNGGAVLMQVIFASKMSGEIQTLLRAFQANIGCIAEFQQIVCDDPDPLFMAGVFEYGIEAFVSAETWPKEIAAVTRTAALLMADKDSAESRTVTLSRSIRSADQGAIKKAAGDLGDMADYDYRIAFAKGKACEATGNYNAAIDAYQAARGMNKFFRPSAASLGETLLVTGRIDEALEVFKVLEKTNPYDVERKANLAAAYIEKGDFEMAQRYVDAAAKMSPNHSKVLEAKAQVLLCTGKVGEAFKLMDDMSEVGPFFAAKLNDLGIQLSQAGKGKSALALYQKAHKIVRPELKYKISLNAALACRRLAAWDMAMKYLARCEKEFGANFPKLDKIRESIRVGKAQQAKAPPAAPAKSALDEAG